MNIEAKDALGTLKEYSVGFGKEVSDVANYLLEDPKLLVWSGSSLKHQHHYGKGGLVRHLYETVTLCLDTSHFFPEHETDPRELFLAALFHDAGKLYDYKPVTDKGIVCDYTRWEGTDHKRYIHHISRSAIMWSEASKRNDLTFSEYHDKVLHAILAHHGTREWGSPVSPKSRVAWLVHHCDCISARMYDADTWDTVKGAV